MVVAVREATVMVASHHVTEEISACSEVAARIIKADHVQIVLLELNADSILGSLPNLFEMVFIESCRMSLLAALDSDADLKVAG
jgi:hypothetical protein